MAIVNDSVVYTLIFFQTNDHSTFRSCLQRSTNTKPLTYYNHQEIDSPKLNLTSMLRRTLSMDELKDTAWLTSSLIDLVLSKFARCYPDVLFHLFFFNSA